MGTMSSLQHPDTTSAGTKRSLSYVQQYNVCLSDKYNMNQVLIHNSVFNLIARELLEQSKPLTDAAKMIVEEKMDKLSAVLNEALDRLKGLSSQVTDLPAAELKKKVDQIVGMYSIPF